MSQRVSKVRTHRRRDIDSARELMSLEANASNVGQMDGYMLNPNLEAEVVNPAFEQ